jgi:hypothetical protein
MNKEIAKIRNTTLGYEDHGIFTLWLHVDYGGAGQGIGGYALDEYIKREGEGPLRGDRFGTSYGMQFIIEVMKAVGVEKWEDVPGKTIFVLTDDSQKVIGIQNLPTEPGQQFLFEHLTEMLIEEEAS